MYFIIDLFGDCKPDCKLPPLIIDYHQTQIICETVVLQNNQELQQHSKIVLVREILNLGQQRFAQFDSLFSE